MISEPDPGTRSVFQKTGDDDGDTVFIVGSESTISFDCGGCGAPLYMGVRSEAVKDIVFQCRDCGAYNEAEGGKP